VRALATTASSLLTLGRVEEAERASREALAVTTASNAQGVLWANIVHCRVAWMRGDPAAAVEHGERAVAAYVEVPSAIDAALAPAFLAEARIAGGDLDRGVAELLAAAGGPHVELLTPTWRPWCSALLAEAELARGDAASARTWGERTAELAAAVGSTSAQGHAERVRALLLLDSGDAAAAAAAARASADAFATIGRRLDAAVAQGLAGSALARAGDTQAGVALLRDAHETLATAGAVLERDRIGDRLRRLGQRVPGRSRAIPRPSHGAAALTPREQEIAELVAQGATNRQIAEHLVISEKTVESHLSRIFAKLGVNSRTAAVHALANSAAED
jgi:DNA-binding NarL/FixJ family response regulator